MGTTHPAEDFFADHPTGQAVATAVARAVDTLGQAEVRVSRSQVAFRRRTGFAYLWRPGQYLSSDVPAVLSIALPRRIDSARFKEIANPAPGVWMHHLELHDEAELDAEVAGWLREAREAAG